jgi:photosystem II stability/assembly factor-like uncharacterized protein
MLKRRTAMIQATVILILLACSFSTTTFTPQQSVELSPTPYPDTPAPVAIDAPLVESPALVNFHFINELDGWGLTDAQVVRTNDGGITWYNVTTSDMTEVGYNVRHFALDANRAWVQVPDFNNYPNSGLMYRTNDGGLTWAQFETPFSGGDVKFLDENHGWMLADLGVGAGSNAVAVYRTDNGGENWTLEYTNDPNQANSGDSLPMGGLKGGITPLNTQTAWVYGVVYSPGTVYLFRTDDGGQTWSIVKSVPLPEGVENTELSIEQLAFLRSKDGWMAMRVTSDEGKMAVYTSNDAGDTWSLTPTLIPGGGSADFLSATEAVIYNGEQFYVTRDAAQTWNNISPNVVFGDTFARMDFVNTSSGWVLTMDPTTNQSLLYRTTDGGSTWSPVIP